MTVLLYIFEKPGLLALETSVTLIWVLFLGCSAKAVGDDFFARLLSPTLNLYLSAVLTKIILNLSFSRDNVK